MLKDAYKARVRKKTNLAEEKLDAMSKDAASDDHLEILRILKKAEESAG